MPRAINGMKECSKCGVFKRVEGFCARASAKDGYRGQCKECEGKYRKENRVEIRRKGKESYYKNIQKERYRSKKYREENKEETLKRCMKWREENKDKIKQCYEKNKEYYTRNAKKHYEENKDKILERTKKYRRKNKKKISKKAMKYRENLNSTYVKNNIRAQLKQIEIPIISEDLIDIKRTIILIKRELKEMDNARN